jgi:hypothetical protein
MADLTTSSAIDTFMQAANQGAARTALGLGTAATQASSAFATAAQGTDARTPTAHAASHVNGTDDIQSATASQKGLATATQITKLDGIEALADVTDAGNVGSSINGASAVTTLNDTDKLPVTVAGTLSNIAYSALKTLLDAIYALKGATTSSGLTMGTGKLLGRGTASTGAIEEITLGTNLSFSGTTLNAATTNQTIQVACSDESTALTSGAAKVTFRMPFAMTITQVRASVNTAPTGSTLIIDINENGTSILSTKLSIDATEKTSTTAATAAVISDSALADDSEITIDIDQVGATVAGAGLKIAIIGTPV